MGWGYYWKPYVSVAARRAKAQKHLEKLRRKGVEVQPVEIAGREIAATFWGEAWCNHQEAFSDFANRLPRGRTYVRNGSVCHLDIGKGKVSAIVSGSEIYNVSVSIATLPKNKWSNLKNRCGGRIGSLLELLQGRLSSHVMEIVTDKQGGLFPLPREIRFKCSCPDWASMCKHVAAVLYGVGARLDREPQLLFLLRGVDHAELVCEEAAQEVAARRSAGARTLDEGDVADVFGIEIGPARQAASKRPAGGADIGRKAAAAKKAAKTAVMTAAEKAAIAAARKAAMAAKKAAIAAAKTARKRGDNASRKEAAAGTTRGPTIPRKPLKSQRPR